jgi:asparagine synthase (glutamine-hydrolysing)
MCGIAGVWKNTNTSLVERMMQIVAHRGPDAEGICQAPGAAGVVGHRRLSIVDPAGGDQPIYAVDRRRAIIANGEIYNFPQLLPTLVGEFPFRSHSDSEAILHLYQRHGLEAVRHLEGMYAFAIVDGERLVLARDPIGIKPLYYAEEVDGFYFASELKALAPFCGSVREFPPGAIYSSDAGFQRFYQIPEREPEPLAPEAAVAEVRRTLEECVVSHLMSDVPLGCFLSGGLDSSIIAALARRHMDTLHTFAVGVAGSRDLEAARAVARHIGSIHHEHILDPAEIRARLPEIIYYLESFDQDLVRSAVPCYFTARIAAQEVKVILTGEGADELFAGYTYYKAIADPHLLHRELRRSLTTLHNINLQRADRLTMAHSIEGRVPFLDLKMIELGQRIPPELKLRGEPAVEKWVLREAFSDLLPEEIVWRRKEQYDEGSGAAELLPRLLASLMSEAEAEDHRRTHPGVALRSAEEAFYHKTLLEVFEHPGPILANVARWAERPV